MIKIGKYVNTHGIKGEIRILSNFSRKDLVFMPNKKIYIKDKEFIIDKYRHHKEFDMVTLKGINNINDMTILNIPSPPTIFNGFVEKLIIPSDANFNIFFNGYFVFPANRSFLSY